MLPLVSLVDTCHRWSPPPENHRRSASSCCLTIGSIWDVCSFMGLVYHKWMPVPRKKPYEATGRTHQKHRTRDALIAAARELVAKGLTPTVEEAAAAAAISRTTAYRYFQ